MRVRILFLEAGGSAQLLAKESVITFDGQNANLISEDARHPKRVVLECGDLLLGHPRVSI